MKLLSSGTIRLQDSPPPVASARETFRTPRQRKRAGAGIRKDSLQDFSHIAHKCLPTAFTFSVTKLNQWLRRSSLSSFPDFIAWVISDKEAEQELSNATFPVSKSSLPRDLSQPHSTLDEKSTALSVSNPPDAKLFVYLHGPNARPLLRTIVLHGARNDAEFFEEIRSLYKRTRGWTRTLFIIKGLHYIEFAGQGPDLTVANSAAVPPDGCGEYDFSPRPAPCVPPFPSDQLVALLARPQQQTNTNSASVLNSIPKLIDFSHEYDAIRWGIHIEEGYSLTGLSILLTFFVLCNVLTWYPISACIDPIGWVQNGLLAASIILGYFLVFWTACFRHAAYPSPYAAATSSLPSIRQLVPYLPVLVATIRAAYGHWCDLLSSIIPWFRDETTPASRSRLPVAPNDPNQIPVRSCSGGAPRSNSAFQTSSTSASQTADGASGSGNASTNETHNTRDGNDQGSSSGNDRDGDGGGSGGGSGDSGNGIELVDLEAARCYLHIIIPDGLSGKKQFAIETNDLRNDYQLAKALNKEYRKQRGLWRAIFSVRSLSPVHYELFNESNVRVISDPQNLAASLPDPNDAGSVYEFCWHPQTPNPGLLLHEAQLTHLYLRPSSSIHRAEDGTELLDEQCLERCPKRKGKLAYVPNNGFPGGYRLEFKESFDFKFLLTCELFIVFIAFLLALLYWFLTKDPQKTSTAINIATICFVVGQFLYAVILALAERLEACRFY